MKEFVVQSGPLRSFDAIYDDRFEKMRAVSDYHTIQISGRGETQRRYMADLRRSADREIQFVAGFFSSIGKGHRTLVGLRDIRQGNAALLARKLKGQDKLRWSEMKYGISEDDLTLVELQDFAQDFQLLAGLIPPAGGESFFYLTASPFDVFDVHWQRLAPASLKAREDRLRRDVVAFAHQAKVVLHQDQGGTFTVVIHPKVDDVDAIENAISRAGMAAGLKITFAPGLFS